jgi:hypothetical protein
MSKIIKILTLIMLYSALLTNSFTTLGHNLNNILYVGQLNLPKFEELSNIYPCLYYDGTAIVVDTKDTPGKFNFNDQRQNIINILFADPEHIEYCSEDNTVFCLKLKKNSPYKLFQLRLTKNFNHTNTKNPSESDNIWQVHESTLGPDLQVLEHTILIALNPTGISCKITGQTAWKLINTTINLPDIEIACENNNCKSLKESLVKSMLGCLNIKPLHSSTKETKIRFNKTLVTTPV